MPIYIPIIVYGLTLLIVVLQELHYIVYLVISFYHFTKFRLHLPVSEIGKWPEGVYCCFTRTTLFTTTLVCSLRRMGTPSFILIGCCVSVLHAHLCHYCNVWPHCLPLTYLFHGHYGFQLDVHVGGQFKVRVHGHIMTPTLNLYMKVYAK